MWLLKLGVICASLFSHTSSFGQEYPEKSWKIGLITSPNLAYQHRSTQRNRAIKMRPSVGCDLGVAIVRFWKDNYIQFSPTVGFSINRTKSSLAFEGFNVNYLFGSKENRFQASLLYGKSFTLNEKSLFNLSFGVSSGYGILNETKFDDLNYSNEEIRIRDYYACLSSGFGITKAFNRSKFYWGIQINQGLLSYTRVHISLNQYQTDFLSRGSSVNLMQIIYLNKN